MPIGRLVVSRLSLRRASPFRGALFSLLAFMALSGGMIAGAAAIKTEIEDGPTRMLSGVGADWWILQNGSDNAITSSFVGADVVDRLAAEHPGEVMGVIREFRKVSGTVQTPRETMIFGLYRPDGPTVAGAVLDASLASSLGVGVGDRIDVAGVDLEVSETRPSLSSIGKEGIIVDASALAGLVPERTVSMIAVTGDRPPPWVDDGHVVYSADEFADLNRIYWRDNASGLALTLIQSIALFGSLVIGVSVAGRLREERRLLASLRAIGASRAQIARAEIGFIAAVNAISIPFQIAIGLGVLAMAASTTPGFHGVLGLASVLAGALGTLVMGVVAGTVMLVWFDRRGLRPLAGGLREDGA